jgi:hypothetical protein
MPENDQGGPPYEVHGSGVIAKRLRQVQRQAGQEGRGEEVLAALRRIYRELQHNPNVFGEPLYRLPGLRMQVRTCLVRPLAVDFAVCEDRPLVFIKGVTLLGTQGHG